MKLGIIGAGMIVKDFLSISPLLKDVKFENVKDFKILNDNLNDIVGVIGTSLFTREATKLIVTGENGVRVILKK